MNTYPTSDGKRYTQSQIDRRITNAKRAILERQIMEEGHNYCENCHSNGRGTRLDCSHNVSVKKAKESGRTELCWDVNNIEILCRDCHQEKDGLNLKFNQT